MLTGSQVELNAECSLLPCRKRSSSLRKELLTVIEAVHRGAQQGRDLIVAPQDRSLAPLDMRLTEHLVEYAVAHDGDA